VRRGAGARPLLPARPLRFPPLRPRPCRYVSAHSPPTLPTPNARSDHRLRRWDLSGWFLDCRTAFLSRDY
jgi:hypothetical protein